MTFDCCEEAIKIQGIYPDAELVLRIAVKETDANSVMGEKFGAADILWEKILQTCKKINIKLRGVSFHVGSGGCSA